ncbi:WD40 repeat domain-containing protein [Nonomuraea sp. CA-143628]|uniref:WD40 repeat domain-containing protein n=1 Tax=Nonomuraea sp. CA-143628 TaxID=3239997 RepID=UPI003D916B20
MSDERMMRGYAGHSHGRATYSGTPVIELDGAPITVSVDEEGVLWTCDLRGGGCVSRPLDLDAAGPDDNWYIENGLWDDDDDEDERRRLVTEPSLIAGRVTVAEVDGRPVVVTGGGRFDFRYEDGDDVSGGIVRAWDLHTGRRIGSVMIGHVLGVCSLTTVRSERGLLAISTCETGRLLAWELTTGVKVIKRQGAYNGEMAAAVVDGRPVAVTGGDDPFLQAWDVLSGERLGADLPGLESPVGGIAITEVEGRTVVLAADGPRLRAWDLATQEPIGAPLTGHTGDIERVVTATVGGRAIALTGGDRDLNDRRGTTILVWDLARGEQIGEPLTGHFLESATEVAGTPVAVTSRSDSAVHLWDLTPTR